MALFNELLTAASSPGILVGIAAVATVLTSYLIKRRLGDANLTVDERKQLSMDEHDFRKSILWQLKACQEAHFNASAEREVFRKLNNALEVRIAELESNCLSCLYRATGEKYSPGKNING
jgi:hypothetical protein